MYDLLDHNNVKYRKSELWSSLFDKVMNLPEITLDDLACMKYLMGQKFDLSDLGKEPKEVSIEDPVYLANKRVYEYAFDMTIKECHQAVEGMYHNLKTLNSKNGEIIRYKINPRTLSKNEIG